MQRQNPWIGTLMIVAVGAGLGLGYNALHPRSLPWIAKPKPVVTLPETGASGSGDATGQVHAGEANPGDASTTLSTQPAAEPGAGAAVSEAPESQAAPGRSGLTGGPAEVGIGPATGTEASSRNPSQASPAPSYADIPESEYPIEIHLAKAKEFYDRGGLLVLDAREAEEFAEGHIQGALSAPTNDKMADLDWLETMGVESRPILVYCGGGDCELSLELGFEITRAGHRRVLVFKEGYPAWKDAGFPVAEGSIP